jgi:uncharacterized membrane protein YqjE
MNWRNLLAVIAGLITLLGVVVLIGMVVRSFWPDYSPSHDPFGRLAILFVSGVIALTVYNLIKTK